jgi:hypothetical protein
VGLGGASGEPESSKKWCGEGHGNDLSMRIDNNWDRGPSRLLAGAASQLGCIHNPLQSKQSRIERRYAHHKGAQKLNGVDTKR